MIFREAPGPASFDFALRGAVVAIASGGLNEESESPACARSEHFKSSAFVGGDLLEEVLRREGEGRRADAR